MSSATFNAEIGRNQFLQLFTAQLQHQDPTQPLGQQEFLQQLAQFSTVEGIEKMNTGLDGLGTKLDSLVNASKTNSDLATLQAINAGTALLGKSVRFGEASGDVGTVSEVLPQQDGQILLKVGGLFMPVDISSVIGVADSY